VEKMKKIEISIEEKKEKLSKVILFQNLNLEELELIAEATYALQFSKDEIIIKEGEIGDCLYILHNGTVKVLKETFAKEQYAVAQIDAEGNAFFGEMALIDKDARTATIKAVSDVVTLVLESSSFENLANNNFRIGYLILKAVAKKLTERLKSANSDIATLFGALEEEIEQEG